MAARKGKVAKPEKSATQGAGPPAQQIAAQSDETGPPPSEQRRNSGNKPPRGKPFEKGKSGNPGGRPKAVAEVREVAREHTLAAIKKLAQWMKSDDPRASVAACSALLDRAWGKSPQAITGLEENNGVITIRVVE